MIDALASALGRLLIRSWTYRRTEPLGKDGEGGSAVLQAPVKHGTSLSKLGGTAGRAKLDPNVNYACSRACSAGGRDDGLIIRS